MLTVRLPFIAISGFGQISALMGAPLRDRADYVASTAMLLAILLTSVILRQRRAIFVVTASGFLAAVSLLILSTGSTQSGLGVLLLLPAVGIGLFGSRWMIPVVAAETAAANFAVSLASQGSGAGLVRRTVLFGLTAIMISFAISRLRMRLEASNRRKSVLLHQAEMINSATTRLVALSDPAAVISVGTEMAARLASPPEAARRANYFRVRGGVVTVADQFDESGRTADATWDLADHPPLARAVETGAPVCGPISVEDFGPSLRATVAGSRITHGAWVPVFADGRLDGVLGVAGRGAAVTDDCMGQLRALAHIVELALANASATERLRHQAASEERRRIARELHDGLSQELAFIVGHTARRVCLEEEDVRELSSAAERALDEARRAITVLSRTKPESLDDAIAGTAEDLGQRLSVPVVLDLDHRVVLPAETTEHLLRIVREAITNAARHARAETLLVRMAVEGGVVRVSVRDDGAGFDPAMPAHGGFGLVSMRERAEVMGAEFRLWSAPGKGTTVEIALPSTVHPLLLGEPDPVGPDDPARLAASA